MRCYDAARAEVRWTVAGAVDGSIAALATSSTASSASASGGLLVVGKTGGASLLDLSSGNVLSKWQASKHAVSAAAVFPSGAALVAGSSLTLHDASSGAKLHKWTGHATLVNALAVTADGSFCCSAAQGERCIAVWSTATGPTGKLRHKSAVAQLSLDEPAVGVSIGSASGGHFHVAAVTVSGTLRLFDCSPAADGHGGAVARQWAVSSGAGSVLTASLEGADSTGVTLVLATGSSVKPGFQQQRTEMVAQSMTEIEIVAGEDGLLLKKKMNKGASSSGGSSGAAAAAVVGADEGVVLARKGGKRGVAALDEDEEMDVMDDDEDDDDEGPTFAARIASLQQGGTPSTTTTAAETTIAAPSGPLKADSLAVLLSQALQSGDKVLLERCLAVRNDDVINKTIKRLAPVDAAAFLRAAVQRLQSAPARGEQLATWIRSVLLHHTAYLCGVAGTQGTLGYLYQLIEARLASYQSLLALSGRLDLVLANARRAHGGDGGDEYAPGVAGPLVTIDVGVDVEDAYAAAAANVEMDEDDDEYTTSSDDGDGDDDSAEELNEDEEEEDDDDDASVEL